MSEIKQNLIFTYLLSNIGFLIARVSFTPSLIPSPSPYPSPLVLILSYLICLAI